MVNTLKINTGSGDGDSGPLSLRSCNHISRLCRSVEDSTKFYENVLGFIRIKRPGSFDFHGAWMFNYGIGIHLLQSPDPDNLPKKTEINPRDNHISFQCDDMQVVERRLQEMNIKYVKRIVEEGGIYVDQLFIHDPDGYMVEICNCENFPVEPIMRSASASEACLRLPSHIQQIAAIAIQKKELSTQIQSTGAEHRLHAGAMRE